MSKLPPLAAIRAFEAAGKAENFSRAAEELGISQAAISYQIRHLEDRIGYPLFVREKGRVRLSEMGERLFPVVNKAFASMQDAFAAIAADDADILTISSAVTFGGSWLGARIGRFQLRHPDLTVRLSLAGELVDFAKSDVDVGLRVGVGPWAGLRCDFLFRSHFTPICSPEFLEKNAISRPEDLLQVDRLAPNDSYWAGWFEASGVTCPLPPSPGVEMDSQWQEANALLNGYGIAMMTPLMWRAELASGRLVQPFSTLYMPGSAHWLVHREQRVGVRKIERFREWLREELVADREGLPAELWIPTA